MNDIIQFIQAKLEEIHSRVYLEQAPPGVQCPYITYVLPDSTQNEFREDFILKVKVWDDQEDTTTLETLMDAVNETLDRLKYLHQNFQIRIYALKSYMVSDPGENIRCRGLEYEIKTYKIKE